MSYTRTDYRDSTGFKVYGCMVVTAWRPDNLTGKKYPARVTWVSVSDLSLQFTKAFVAALADAIALAEEWNKEAGQ